MKKGFLLWSLLLLAGCATNAPTSLRCDFQEDDVVIDVTATPRLSWINTTEQTAYQIIVTDIKDVTIWDSGKTESDESHLVPYAGPGMEPMKE